MEKHQKHAKLTRRKFGEYSVNELAIVGTKCSVVAELVSEISAQIPGLKLAYFDASHNKETQKLAIDTFTFHHSGMLQIEKKYLAEPYQNRLTFNEYDLVFLNGNHYAGNRQILVLDKDKEASVKKRIEQLDNVQFIIKLTEDVELFDFLTEKYPQLENLPVYAAGDIKAIGAHIKRIIREDLPPVKGLVLAGGKSTRMGTDKGLLDFHGMSQRDYALQLLEKRNLETFLSVRKEQQIDYPKVVEDVFLGLGPFGAICSAFQTDPNSAWMVIATDLPFVDQDLIETVLENRDPSKIATAVKGKNKPFPEPLITLWEPKAYQRMLQFLAMGISCPRKVLINSDVKIVEVDDERIANVNTPEDFENALKKLHG